MTDIARVIVDKIRRDFCGRCGLEDAWEECDADIQKEIDQAWYDIAKKAVFDLRGTLISCQARAKKFEKERDEARIQALEGIRKALDDVIHWKAPWTLESSVLAMFKDVEQKLKELKCPATPEEIAQHRDPSMGQL